MDPFLDPNSEYNQELQATANLNNPRPDKVATSPVPSNFSVNVNQTVPSSSLSDGITIDDVFTARNQMEADRAQGDPLEGITGQTSTPTPFDDPESFIRDRLFGEQEPTATEKEAAGIRKDITRTTEGISSDLTQVEQRAERTTGISGLQAGLAETNEKIALRQARFRRELRAMETDATSRGVARQFYQDELNKLEADATAELADLYIIQNAQSGNVEAARDYIKTAVDNKYRSIEAELAAQQARLNEVIPRLEGEKKDEAIKLQLALDERANNLAEEKATAQTKRELLISMAQSGASETERRKLMNAATLDQAYEIAANFTARQFRAAGTGAKAPTIKTINGVDYQWNETLGIWEQPSGTGGSADQGQAALDNLNFLLDTTERVLGNEAKGYEPLYKGAGAARLPELIKEQVFGADTTQNRLEAQVDTLRANMLTLATDPSIKEFFGPQMSDADVRLMTAAGTTLRPGSQSPDDLRAETIRIQDFINRAKTAIERGISSSQNIITAPDGTLVQIVD